MDKKRIGLVIGFILFSIGIAYALYYVFFRTPTPDQPGETETGTETGGAFPNVGEGTPNIIPDTDPTLPPSTNVPGSPSFTDPITSGGLTGTAIPGSERVVQVVTNQVRGVSTAGGTGAKFYNAEDGKFYCLNSSGVAVPLSDTVFYNVQNVSWSPTNNDSILEYPDGSNIYYNFDSKEQVTLPRHWESFSFSPQGDQIVAKSVGIAPENRWLVSAAPNGSTVKLLEPMGNNADKVTVDWSPNRQVVAFSKTGAPLGDDRQEILLVGQNKENFKSLVVEGRGLQTKWSKQGSKLLHSVYSSASDFKPELWIADGTPDTIGGNRKLLGVKTWASKCGMADERFIYCGVPETLDTGAGFAPAVANTTPDRLYKIDAVTGLKTDIPLVNTHTIETITISDDGRTLYFTDKNKPGIFQVNI